MVVWGNDRINPGLTAAGYRALVYTRGRPVPVQQVECQRDGKPTFDCENPATPMHDVSTAIFCLPPHGLMSF